MDSEILTTLRPAKPEMINKDEMKQRCFYEAGFQGNCNNILLTHAVICVNRETLDLQEGMGCQEIQ